MAFKRLPNGYGQIDKLPGARRKPYRARKRIGTKDGKPVYATIGYFADKGEALRQLALTNDKALVKEADITFGECLELWKQEYLLTKPLPHSLVSSIKHLTPLEKRKMVELKAIDLESIINTDKIPRTMKIHCVVALHGVFSYAVRHEIITKDYSRIAKYALDASAKIERKVYTAEEIDELWKRYDIYDKITLIQLYSGMRIAEVIEMKSKDTFPEEGYMIGGLKTKAGRNRYIPIHPAIYMLLKEFKEQGNEYLVTNDGKRIPRRTIQDNIKRRGHLTHDARHTFATQAYKCGIAEADIKRIMGHSQGNVTQGVYIHPDNTYLIEEITKLFY